MVWNPGGWIVLHLLQRGEDPSHIRILDNRPPKRRDLCEGLAAQVKYLQVDVTAAIDQKPLNGVEVPMEHARYAMRVAYITQNSPENRVVMAER